MPGIYIHIPFCRRKCHYCNFFSLASGKYKERFLHAIKEEIRMRRDYLGTGTADSVYFGGGTPSLLESAEIDNLLSIIRQTFILSDDCEITLEANPDDLSPDILDDYMKTGINRLSIGVQSFFDDDLEYLNRIHSAEKAEQSVFLAKEAGFSNLSIDLIYGIPTLTIDKWHGNLEKAFELDVPHISAYSLTVEPGTALDLLIKKKKLAAPDEESDIAQFRLMMQLMKNQGFKHYEISNFCKNEMYSRHNSMYWSGTPYLGLGPAAHSYNGTSRQWNLSNLVLYIDQAGKGEQFREQEILTPERKFNEYVMVSLRTQWGCDIVKIGREFGDEAAVWFENQASAWLSSGHLTENNGVYTLTDEGKLLADGIASNLFLET